MNTLPLPRLEALRKRCEAAQMLIELVEAMRMQTPLRHNGVYTLQYAAHALILPLCENSKQQAWKVIDRAEWMIDRARRAGRPRHAAWLDHLLGRFAALWAQANSDEIPRADLDAYLDPTTQRAAADITAAALAAAAQDLLELADLDAATQHQVDSAATALIEPACDYDHVRALAIVKQAHSLPAGERGCVNWLGQLIAQEDDNVHDRQ